VRLPATALMLGGLIACLAPMIVARRRITARGVVVDERDLEILALVFWSCALVYSLALPVGILLGYRRR